jgi:uncharacterized protein (TIGR00369 family)
MPLNEAARLLSGVALHVLFGFELLEWSRGSLVMRFVPPDLVRDPDSRLIHGGALATALDTAACFAAIAAVGEDCATVDLRIDYLRPALDDTLLVTGALVRLGRRFAWSDAAVTTNDGRPLTTARGLFTW